MYAEGFASKLKSARQRTGFTQREVSKEIGISQSTLANYETGRTQPDLENLGILADFYNVSLDWLIGTKGDIHELYHPRKELLVNDDYTVGLPHKHKRLTAKVVRPFKKRS